MAGNSAARFVITALARAAAVALAWGGWRRSPGGAAGPGGEAGPPSAPAHDGDPAAGVPACHPAPGASADHEAGWSLDLSDEP